MKVQFCFRIDTERLARLKTAIAKLGPYAPSITQVIERGVDLALREMEKARCVG